MENVYHIHHMLTIRCSGCCCCCCRVAFIFVVAGSLHFIFMLSLFALMDAQKNAITKIVNSSSNNSNGWKYEESDGKLPYRSKRRILFICIKKKKLKEIIWCMAVLKHIDRFSLSEGPTLMRNCHSRYMFYRHKTSADVATRDQRFFFVQRLSILMINI